MQPAIAVAESIRVKNAKLREEFDARGTQALVANGRTQRRRVAALMREIERSSAVSMLLQSNNVGNHTASSEMEATSGREIDALYETNLRNMFVVKRLRCAPAPQGKGAS